MNKYQIKAKYHNDIEAVVVGEVVAVAVAVSIASKLSRAAQEVSVEERASGVIVALWEAGEEVYGEAFRCPWVLDGN